MSLPCVVYQDPTNLQGKIQKHQAFEAELNANQSRLDAVDNTGEQLIGDGHYASDQIRERLDELHKLWAYLFERSNDKGKSDLKINVLLANILKLEIAWSSLGQVTDDEKGRKQVSRDPVIAILATAGLLLVHIFVCIVDADVLT